MARNSVHSTDLMPHDEFEGLVDFSALQVSSPHRIETITAREWETTAEAEAFMHEPMVIEIHPTTDKNASPVVPLAVNGAPAIAIPRGRPVRILRHWVEALAHSRVSGYRQVKVQDPNADEGFSTHRTSGQDYPFSVLQDKNPKGRRWLERVLREA